MKTIKRLTVIFFAVLILWVPHGQVSSSVLENGAFMIPALTTRPMKQTSPQTLKIARIGTPISKTINTTCEQYRPILAQYSWDVDTMMRIMKAESGCNASSTNPTDRHETCLGSYGLLQIACSYFKVGEDKHDVALNIQKAYVLYKTPTSYRHWTTF